MTRKITIAFLSVSFVAYSLIIYTKATEQPAQMLLSGKARQGKLIFQQKNCGSCHQLFGLGGYLGPDLTKVISSKGPAYAGALIKHGTAKMPDLGLSDAEIECILEYLSYTDRSLDITIK